MSAGNLIPQRRRPAELTRASAAIIISSALGITGVCVLSVVMPLPHNARPLLELGCGTLSAALIGGLIMLELALGSVVLAKVPILLRRIIIATAAAGALTSTLAVIFVVTGRPDPDLYRVPSAVAAVRAAEAALPQGIGEVRIVSISSVPDVSGSETARAWHLRLESFPVPTRSFDVVIDARSGEVFRTP